MAPVALAPDDCDLALSRDPRGRDPGVAFPVPMQIRHPYNIWMDEALLIHPTNWRSWRSKPLFGSGLAGLELVEERRKDLLCLSDLRNGLGLVDIAGLSNQIIATIPMP
jgi:hypothetical protein